MAFRPRGSTCTPTWHCGSMNWRTAPLNPCSLTTPAEI